MRRIVPFVLAAIVISAATAATRLTRPHRRATVTTTAHAEVVSPTRAAELRDLDIAFWSRRAATDPLGAEDRVQLAALLAQRARETGSYTDYLRADSVVREALRIRPMRNDKGYTLLASVLMAQHRFDEAYAIAKRLDDAEPGVAAFMALRGEIALELGRYDDARRCFDSLLVSGAAIEGNIATRVARFDEIEGRSSKARGRLVAAAAAAARATSMPAEQRAWYRLRVADFDLRHGRLNSADSTLRIALTESPEDYRLLGTMARLEWMRGRWRQSAEYGERAVAVTLDPATLALLSDDYASMGDSARAAEFADAMRAAVMAQTGPLHRAWSLFLLDHGRDLRGVLDRSREELRTRRDVYGWDVEAWALHALGRDSAADVAMQRALAEGTEDAMLEYHAGVIAQSANRTEEARMHLERALTINSAFHPRQAADARRRLCVLRSSLCAALP